MIDFRDQFLEAHNIERAYHGSGPLEWSDELAAHAQKQANACAANGQLFHGNSKEYGEGQNVSREWCSCAPDRLSRQVHHAKPAPTATEVVSSWFRQGAGYNFETHTMGGAAGGDPAAAGNFTQLLWFETTHVGAARSASGEYVVANYSPPGNYVNKFGANVFPGDTSMDAVTHIRYHTMQSSTWV